MKVISAPPGERPTLASLIVGLSLGGRTDHWVFGGSAEAGITLLGHRESYLSVYAGPSVADNLVRWTLVGELGRHSYSDLGGDILSDEGGTTALPFVGGRASLDRSFRDGGGGVLLGLWAAVRRDVGTASVVGARTSGNHENWQVGGTAILLGLEGALSVPVTSFGGNKTQGQ